MQRLARGVHGRGRMRVRVALGSLLVLGACAMTVEGEEGRPEGAVVSAAELPAAGAAVDETLAWLAAEAGLRSPGTELAVAYEDLSTGGRASVNGDVLHVSASSAKAWWAAAAAHEVGAAAVAPHATAVFAQSDNWATGAVIDLIGPDAVNRVLWDAFGMGSTALTSWSYGGSRVASNSPRAMGWDNYTTADDAVTFLAGVYRGETLAPPERDALLGWMTLSPRTGFGGWLGTRLPPDVAAGASHKAGWLPPGCCSSDATYNTLNDVGVVTAPDGRAYAVAILARRGHDWWGRQARFVELASCMVYRAHTQDASITCGEVAAAAQAGCGDITYEGTCDGSVLTWCEAGSEVRVVDCGASGEVCDWQSDDVGYNCL